MLGVGQVEAWNGTGAMKSFSSAEVDEPEERALTMREPKAWHVFGLNPAASSASARLIDASPKSPMPTFALLLRTSGIAEVLTAASAKPWADRSCWFTQADPFHVNCVMSGVPLPPQ